MANELPYFRFTVQAWQNGKIDIERYELKGFYIDLCGYYWVQDCDLTLKLLQKKYSNDLKMIDELIDLGIIKYKKREDKIEIEFLNIQYDLLSEKRRINVINGSKGGKARANAKQTLKQNPSYKDKDNNKDKDKDKDKKEEYDFLLPEFVETFFSWMTYKIKRKEKYKSIESEKLFYLKLLKLSNNDPLIAKEIIEQSMSNNWAGIFELKQSFGNSQKPTSPSIIQKAVTAHGSAMQKIEEKYGNGISN